MSIDIKLNGTSIIEYVVSYSREQKICTGIGTFEFSVEENSPLSFSTWDEVDLYENSVLVNKYFIATFSSSHPNSLTSVSCQDGSKRIVDYFIVDSYTVDYPSTAKYWAEKFLTEAGVNYSFSVADNGALLSNMTALGLMTVYEQMQYLLQISGWYMYFSSDSILNIGDLNKNLSPVDFSFSRDEIKSVSYVKDDKMLRNRAVVYGGYSPDDFEQVAVDVSVNTKWNYDSSDERAVVISNSNINSTADAYDLANTALMEFATITHTKFIEVIGHYNVKLGDVIMVNTDTYTGKGLVTSVGTSMSSSGLFTNIVLDERCPRLFGFFNFGGFVYVGTYGSGVWRKNIEYGTSWANYSEGIDTENLEVVDLYISDGILACVTSDGTAYHRQEGDSAWSRLSILNLETVVASGEEDLFVSGILEGDVVTSGILARSCVVDPLTSKISYVCDIYSGYTPASYSGYYSGSGIFAPSGTGRAWVVDYDYATAETSSIPLQLFNDYSLRAFDIEADGSNRFPTVATASSTVDLRDGYDYGEADSFIDFGYSNYNAFGNLVTEESIESEIDFYAMNKYNEYENSYMVQYINKVEKIIGVYDNTETNMSFSVATDDDHSLASIHISKFFEAYYGDNVPYINASTYTFTSAGMDVALFAKFIDEDTYAIYGYTISSEDLIIKKSTLTLSTLGVVTTNMQTIEDIAPSTLFGHTVDTDDNQFKYLVSGNKLVFSTVHHFDIGGDDQNVAIFQHVYDVISDTIDTSYFYEDILGTDWRELGDHKSYRKFFILEHEENFTSMVVCIKNTIGFEWYTEPFNVYHYHANTIIVALFAGHHCEEVEMSRTFYTGSERNATDEILSNWIYTAVDYRGINYTSNNAIYFLSYYSRQEYPNNYYTAENVYETYYYYIKVTNANIIITTEACIDANQPMYPDGHVGQDSNEYNIKLISESLEFGIARELDYSPTNLFFTSDMKTFDTTNLEVIDSLNVIDGNLIYDFASDAITASSGKYYVSCKDVADTGDTGMGEYDMSTGKISNFSGEPYVTMYDKYIAVRGNFLFRRYNNSSGDSYTRVEYFGNGKTLTIPSTTAVLKVDSNDDVDFVQGGIYPIKVDVSKASPVFTVQDIRSSLQAHIINEEETESTDNIDTEEFGDVYDIRYAYYSHGGEAAGVLGLYTSNGMVYSIDMDSFTPSSGILSVSGVLNHLETTNNFYPDQYIFASEQGSGVSHHFYQKNVNSDNLVDRTYNLPEREITVIRVDDRV